MNLIPIAADTNFDSVMNNGLSFSEKAFQSVQMLLMGMGTVFSVMIVIWLALTLFRIIMHDIPEKRAKARALSESRRAAENGAVEGNAAGDGALDEAAQMDAAEAESADEDGLVTAAVITAALQAYMDSEGVSTPFKVVSFKRKGSAPWNGGRI